MVIARLVTAVDSPYPRARRRIVGSRAGPRLGLLPGILDFVYRCYGPDVYSPARTQCQCKFLSITTDAISMFIHITRVSMLILIN